MARVVRTLVALSTLVLIGVSGLGLAPWLGQGVPVASAQFNFGGGQFGGSCGFNFGGLQIGGVQLGNTCSFGGFSGGLQLGGGQVGGFNFGNACGGFNLGGGLQLGGFQFSGQCGGLQFGGVQFGGVQFGIFTIVSPASTVQVGQHVPITFVWETPLPTTSDDLRSLELRLREESGAVAFWVRWDEATGAFSLIDPATEQPIRSAQPGSSDTFDTELVTLHLAESTVSDTGSAGPLVALLLPISARSSAEGRSFQVEERATSDAGQVEGFRSAGTIVVAAQRGNDQTDLEDTPRRVLTAQQRQRTDRSGKDDVHTEGDVVGADCQADIPTATIMNRDGKVTVNLLKDAASVCKSIRSGDYLEADGEKVHELLFEAFEVSVTRR